ncbi:MAG: hypothetical protein R3A52_07050 [Polyangiales bacterium]
MWWTQGVTVALVATTVLGAFLLYRQGLVAAVAAWSIVMSLSTGWFAYGAWQMASGLSALGEGMQRAFGGDHAPRPRASAPTSAEPPELSPPPTLPTPERYAQFPAQPGAPVQAEALGVNPGELGLGRNVDVRLRNTSAEKSVDGVRFEAWCYDNFGALLHNPSDFDRTSPGFRMIHQEVIAPGATVDGSWRVTMGAELCTRARIWVNAVHFTDGSTWESDGPPRAAAPHP